MKKRFSRIAFCLVLALVLLMLPSCGRKAETEPGIKTVQTGGHTFTIDESRGTISDEKSTYRYKFESRGQGYTLSISYPNGYHYSWTHDGNSGYGSSSLDADFTGYADPWDIMDALEYQAPRTKGESHVGIGLLLLALGLLNALKPEISWMLSDGWRYKNAEPSDTALGLNRLAGAVMIFFGIIAIISSF